MSAADPLSVLGRLAGQAWLVGGAVRDELLDRATEDFDVVVEGDLRELARALGRATDAHSFALSEAFGAWRVIARDRAWRVDLTPLMGGSLGDDLARRDLTINAMARKIGDPQLIDPHGGLGDLRARQLRMVSDRSFRDDPLRPSSWTSRSTRPPGTRRLRPRPACPTWPGSARLPSCARSSPAGGPWPA